MNRKRAFVWESNKTVINRLWKYIEGRSGHVSQYNVQVRGFRLQEGTCRSYQCMDM